MFNVLTCHYLRNQDYNKRNGVDTGLGLHGTLLLLRLTPLSLEHARLAKLKEMQVASATSSSACQNLLPKITENPLCWSSS